jgi:uncharacterized RDD family membrane protein YckC
VGYASWGRRAGAIFADWLLIPVPGFIGWIVGGLFLPALEDTFVNVGFYLGLIGYPYSRWYLGGKTGQSWGRAMFEIRLVDEFTGKPVGFGRALLRDITHILDLPFLIGFIRPMVNAQAQTWADELGRTVVVPAKVKPEEVARLRPGLLPDTRT